MLNKVDIFGVSRTPISKMGGVQRELSIPDEKPNNNAESIAIGQLIGTSKCYIVATLIHELKKTQKVLATICAGESMCCSTVVRRCAR